MKFVFTFACVLVCAAAAFSQSANGHGTLLVTDVDGSNVRRQFSFTARTAPDGTVTGNAVLHNPAADGANGNQPYMLQINVECLNIIGNVAYVGGTTRRTTDPNLVDAVFFAVQDNGQPGRNSDLISLAFFWDDDPGTTGDPQACQSLPSPEGPSPNFVIESGNIIVRQ